MTMTTSSPADDLSAVLLNTAYSPSLTGEDEFIEHDEPATESSSSTSPSSPSAQNNFILASTLFSINHGCVTSCLNLATARLGDVGALQSAVLYISYAASSLLGSTWITKILGAKYGMILGMAIYCVYVSTFVSSTLLLDHPIIAEVVALSGAAVGGLAGGIIWTAQGSFFARSAEVHSDLSGSTLPDTTSDLGAYFAAIYLLGEVTLNMLSSFLVEAFGLSWIMIFLIYFSIAVLSVAGMRFVYEYPSAANTNSSSDNESAPNKATAAWRLLTNDPKIICMVPFNFVFGFAASFRASFISREVVRIALHDNNSKYIGFLSSVTAIIGAAMSLFFGRMAHRTGKGVILVLGAASFFMVAFPFVVFPDLASWGWASVLSVYIFQGIGRSTFEGTLKAEFADFFKYEKEGAFANITLQNGLSSALGFYLSVNLPCQSPGKYCIEFSDGTLHNVLAFELLVIVMAFLAIIGYYRAAALFKRENSQGGGMQEEQVAFTTEPDEVT